MLDGFLVVDSAAKTSSGKLRTFPVVSMPSPFSGKYTVRGLPSIRDVLTQDIQNAILESPHLLMRPKGKWFRRVGTLPGLSERFASIDTQDFNPHTLSNRLDSLMDWAEFVNPKSQHAT